VQLLLEPTADLVGQDGAALHLACSRQTLWRLRRSGQLEAVSHGGRLMYRRADLERLRLEGWDVPTWPDDTIPPGCK